MTIRTNKELSEQLRGKRSAQFVLCDFHVHSPASYDVVSRPELNEIEKEKLGVFLGTDPKNWAAHQTAIFSAFPPSEYLSHLIQRRDEVVNKLGMAEYNKWAVLAITDHNVCKYSTELAQLAWNNRKKNKLFILPGIELDVEFPLTNSGGNASIHLLCIFRPGTAEGDIRIAIREASTIDWKEGDSNLTVSSLEDFVKKIRHHPEYPAMVIAAHVATSKGVQKEVTKGLLSTQEAEIAHLEAELESTSNPKDAKQLTGQLEVLKSGISEIHMETLRTIGRCGFDALQVSNKGDEKHYRRLHRYRVEHGRAVPLISSDAHSLGNIFHVKGEAYPQLKLSNKFIDLDEAQFFTEVRDHAVRYGETRFNYSYSGEVTHWIEGIEVLPDADDASNFWPNTDGLLLPFSRNLNCLIGGRGSGKSAVIEALAFLLSPSDSKSSGKEKDWYGRAKATLSGCKLRLCWKAIGDGVAPELYKGVFLSRYFNPNDRHEEISIADIDGKNITLPIVPQVQIYRFNDIEETAEPSRLRNLIDEIAGGIGKIEQEINSVRTQLGIQRTALVEEAKHINELTKNGSHLRRYAEILAEYQRVNKPEVAAHFTKLDAIESAGKSLKNLRENWDSIASKLDAIDSTEFETLLDEIANVITSSDKDYLAVGLSKLIDGNDSPLRKLISSLQELALWKGKANEGFNLIREDIKSQWTTLRNDLSQQGLTGSTDRAAKKKELDEATEALEKYRKQISSFNKLLEERLQLFEELKSSCQERTTIRVSTAEKITNQLRQDLDDDILKIEASAQQMADKTSFKKWLEKYLQQTTFRYKQQRIDSLLNEGLTPEIIKNILLKKRNDGESVLLRDRGRKATDGDISTNEVSEILKLEAISRYEPEIALDTSQANPIVFADLPQEIRDGLQYFPKQNDVLLLEEVLKLDEIIFDDIPVVLLNDRPKDSGSTLRPLDELSPGQRCSAVLPILLLNGHSPLIIDQPEDNLDNRLIRQVIVNVLGSIKLRRQVIVATHNPNIPVLGDSEQTIVLAAIDEKQSKIKGCGNLDEAPIISAITEIMEGGREAFQYRQAIYQNHWNDVVED